jgi:predicted transcriptional regulator
MKVKEVMTSCLPSVTPETSLEDIIALMYAHHTRYVPVFSGCSFEGLITMYNIMSTMLETREPVFEEKTETERTKTFSLAY